MSKTIYVGFFVEDFFFNTSYEDVINFFNQQFPNNTLVIKIYIVTGTPEDNQRALEQFLTDFPSGERAVICLTTTLLTQASRFFEEKGLDILSISLGSASNAIFTLNNALSYGYADQFSVIAYFLIFKDFRMKQIKILLDPDSPNQVFYRTLRELVEKQASLLNIPYTVDTLQVGRFNYGIQPKTFILILAADQVLKDRFITPQFLKNIPPKCYISLTIANPSAGDIYGQVPAIVPLSFPLNYTPTSQQVYESLSPENKKLFFYVIYPLYDTLFVLNRFTTSPLPVTKENYRNINAYDQSEPAWASNNLFDLKLNRIPFGNFNFIFTKNSVIKRDGQIYLTYYKGGHMVLPDSNSVFLTAGLLPYVDNFAYYDENPYYKMYVTGGRLFLTAFANDSTTFPPLDQNLSLNYGSNGIKKFVFSYTEEGLFKTLERLKTKFMPQVNLTMSKEIIKQTYPVIV